VERTILVALLISAGVIYEFIQPLNQGMSMEKARTIIDKLVRRLIAWPRL
jgi:hypothetical protein